LTSAKAALRLAVSEEHRRDPMYAAQARALVDVARARFGRAPYAHERRAVPAAPAAEVAL
jgi:hypothetical protein